MQISDYPSQLNGLLVVGILLLLTATTLLITTIYILRVKNHRVSRSLTTTGVVISLCSAAFCFTSGAVYRGEVEKVNEEFRNILFQQYEAVSDTDYSTLWKDREGDGSSAILTREGEETPVTVVFTDDSRLELSRADGHPYETASR